MNWANPWAFALLLPLLITTIVQWRKKPPTIRLSSIEAFGKTPKLPFFTRFHTLILLEALAATLIIIALARPQKGIEKHLNSREGIDIILTLDLSGSMKAYDPKDGSRRNDIVEGINSGTLKTRVETAKVELQKFIKQRPNDRIGLVVFGVKAYIDSPPTLDHEYLKKKIAKIDIETLGEYSQGTNIADAIARSTNTLKEVEAKKKIVILFTDGENSITEQITPLQAAELASDFNIIIHTVGIGSDNPVEVVRSFGGHALQAAQGTIDIKLLKSIAEKTEGQFFMAKAQEGFAKVMEEINKLEKTSVKEASYTNYKELYPPYLYAAIGFFLLSFLLSKTLLLRMP